jgi:hypothetical protein
MSAQQPRYSAAETTRRGDAIYERTIRAQVEATQVGMALLYRYSVYIEAVEGGQVVIAVLP